MMQTQLPPALAALMQTAQMVNPSTRQPTVAQDVANAAMQKMQGPSAPPGIAALMPGVKQQAMNMAQAMQPATRGDVQRAMQSAVGSLSADVRMAEGGIVGFSGDSEFGSSVPDPIAIAMDELRVSEFNQKRKEEYERQVARNRAYRQQQEVLKQQAAEQQRMKFLEENAPETAAAIRSQKATAMPNIPEGSDRRLNIPAGGIVSPGMAASAPAPAPADRKKRAPAPAPAPAPSAPIETMMDTRNIPMPSEARDMYEEMRRRIDELGGRLRQPTPETPEQQAYRKAQEDQYNRGIAGIAEQRRRYEEAEAARRAALKDQPMENLISRLTRVGGAGSLFGGLAQAARGMEPIIAGQRAAEQAANEKKLQYFDLLDQRKETVEGLKLAALKGDADRVAAETARLRAVDAEIAKLGIDLGAKQAGQLLTGEQAMARTKAEIDARAAESEKDRRARAALQSRPGPEQQMIERVIKSLMDANPGMAYHEAYDKARGSGKGLAERQDVAELKALITSLKDQADPMKNFDKSSREQASVLLKQAQDKLAQMSGVGGGSTGSQAPMYAKNPKTGERIMSTDGGQTWKPAQ